MPAMECRSNLSIRKGTMQEDGTGRARETWQNQQKQQKAVWKGISFGQCCPDPTPGCTREHQDWSTLTTEHTPVPEQKANPGNVDSFPLYTPRGGEATLTTPGTHTAYYFSLKKCYFCIPVQSKTSQGEQNQTNPHSLRFLATRAQRGTQWVPQLLLFNKKVQINQVILSLFLNLTSGKCFRNFNKRGSYPSE